MSVYALSFAPNLLRTSFSWQGDDKFFIFNLRIAEIFLRLNVWIDNTVFSAEEFCLFVSSLFAKVVPCLSNLTAQILFCHYLMDLHYLLNIPLFLSGKNTSQ